MNKAAAQNYPPALFGLVELHRQGLVPPESRISQEEINQLLLKSANLGFSPANAGLARNYYNGENGFEQDSAEAYFRASVAFALDEKDPRAANLMRDLHYAGSGMPERSPYLACYYLNIAAKEDKNGTACYNYGRELQELIEYLHDGYSGIIGSNVTPALFFWTRKSRDLGLGQALEQLKIWETIGRSECANCGKEAQAGEKFKQCSNCKAQWYCSKECQIEAWKVGHKKDCKRAGILNFEDYINAE